MRTVSMICMWIIRSPDWNSHIFCKKPARKSCKSIGKYMTVSVVSLLFTHPQKSKRTTFAYHFREHEEYTIYLHIELFGYEDLLYELARCGIKIQLFPIHKKLFKYVGLEKVFDYAGEPNIIVCPRVRARNALHPHNYERSVLKK